MKSGYKSYKSYMGYKGCIGRPWLKPSLVTDGTIQPM